MEQLMAIETSYTASGCNVLMNGMVIQQCVSPQDAEEVARWLNRMRDRIDAFRRELEGVEVKGPLATSDTPYRASGRDVFLGEYRVWTCASPEVAEELVKIENKKFVQMMLNHPWLHPFKEFYLQSKLKEQYLLAESEFRVIRKMNGEDIYIVA